MRHFWNSVRLVRESCGKSDRNIVSFLLSHTNLVTAFTALGLAIWGLSLGHYLFFVGMILIGGLSYFLGISVALIVGVMFGVFRLVHPTLGITRVTVAIVEMVGYTCISWLGYRHKELKQIQKFNESVQFHTDQVVPWAVANEVRTSLAAVRFLLFPLHDEVTSRQLETVTKELSRLEHIFSEIESHPPQQQRKNG